MNDFDTYQRMRPKGTSWAGPSHKGEVFQLVLEKLLFYYEEVQALFGDGHEFLD